MLARKLKDLRLLAKILTDHEKRIKNLESEPGSFSKRFFASVSGCSSNNIVTPEEVKEVEKITKTIKKARKAKK